MALAVTILLLLLANAHAFVPGTDDTCTYRRALAHPKLVRAKECT